MIVCDTNILVNSAKSHLLMRLMDDWSHASDGEISLHVTALVPYIVLKELDGLKAGRRHSDPDAHSGMDSIRALLLFPQNQACICHIKLHLSSQYLMPL